MARRDYAGNAVPTTLAAGINPTDLTISILDATGWPTGGANGKFFVTIDPDGSAEERVLVASRTGTTLTVAAVGDRGVDETSAASHAIGVGIIHSFAAVEADEANAHIYDTGRDDHAQYLNNARHDIEARHSFGGAYGTPGAPADIGTVPAAGAGARPSREDHVHQLGAGSIDSSTHFAAGVVDAAALAANAVTTAKIAPDAVTNTQIADNAVDSPQIAAGAVGNTELADLSVDTNKIALLAIVTGLLADDSVTAAKVADGAIDATAKLTNGIVTMAKMASEAASNYAPSFGGLSGGSNVTFGRYFKFGRLVVGVAGFDIGAGGNITSDMNVSLPEVAAAGTPDWIVAVRGIHPSTGSRATGMGLIQGSSSLGVSFATIGTGTWDTTNPWNWEPGDNFRCVFVYEASS